MIEITTDDIWKEIRATKRRLKVAVNEGQIPDDYVTGAAEFFRQIHEIIVTSIEAGRGDGTCDWMHYTDLVWAKFDVEDMIEILEAILELPRWD